MKWIILLLTPALFFSCAPASEAGNGAKIGNELNPVIPQIACSIYSQVTQGIGRHIYLRNVSGSITTPDHCDIFTILIPDRSGQQKDCTVSAGHIDNFSDIVILKDENGVSTYPENCTQIEREI